MKPISTSALVCITLAFLLFSQKIAAQKKFTATAVNSQPYAQLRTHFSKHSLFSINTADIADYAKSKKGGKTELELELPGFADWKFSITEHDILSDDYTLVVNSPQGKTTLPKPACMTYEGYLSDISDSKVRLTIDNKTIYGIIKSGDKEYFIEPLRYFNNQAAANIFVVYDTKDVTTDPSLTCGVKETEQKANSVQRLFSGLNCVRTRLAIASDESMFIRYGSAADVQTHNIGVMNNVIWDYVNAQFADNIEFVIVTQNVSTSAPADQLSPSYAGTNCNTIIANFRTWGEAGNFGTAYDLGQFWTTRNIDNDGAGDMSGIVGLAYQPALCGSFKYHILEDFAGSNPSGSGYQLRVLTSHEIGHNFNCSHDGVNSGFIMAPSVDNTSTWSPASIATVDGYVPGLGCLSTCSSAGVPVSDFIGSPLAVCAGGTMQLIDHSLRGPTSWSWTMTDGTPASSTIRNPTVTYATSGIKNISLTSSNGGGTGSTFSKNVLVSNSPTTACSNTGVIASDAGVKFFGLGSISRSSGGSATDGNKYIDNSCPDITILTTSTLYTATVTIGDAGTSTFNIITFYIDYNNDGDFNDTDELAYSSYPSGFIGTVNFDFTTPASPTTNQFLRTRIIAKDFIGIADNPCHNPSAGQVEDYSVYFASGILLPVSLLDFSGYHHTGKNVLNWQTASEKENSHFDIERSIDGTSFESIGRQPGAINNNTISNYSFTDQLGGGFANYNRLYYRLKIVSLSGRAEYSKIIAITTNTDKKELLVSIQPNPFTNAISATIQLKKANSVTMQLMDMTGRTIYQQERKLPAGIHTLTYNNFDNLANGVYVLKLTGNNEIVSRLIEKK